MSVQVLGEAIYFGTNINFTNNLILDVGKNITFSSGSSFVATGNVYFPESSKVYIGNNTQTLATTLADGIPKGCIMMWYSGAIPTGWMTCNGNGGVPVNGISIPDLRGMFIMGSGTGTDGVVYNVNSTGGNLNHSITLGLDNFPSHQHTGTTGTGGAIHTHKYYTGWGDSSGSERLQRSKYSQGTVSWYTDYNEHSHTLTINNSGNSSPLSIMPSYTSLIYIIKTI